MRGAGRQSKKEEETKKQLSEAEISRRRRLNVLKAQTDLLLKHQPETLSRDCTQYELFAVVIIACNRWRPLLHIRKESHGQQMESIQ